MFLNNMNFGDETLKIRYFLFIKTNLKMFCFYNSFGIYSSDNILKNLEALIEL